MKKFIYLGLTFAPVLALAQTTNLSGVSTLIKRVGDIMNQLIPVLFALAILFFFWGLITFLRAAGDSKMKEQGQAHMIYGIIAIAVMVSVYGLVYWLQSTLGISNVQNVNLPSVNIPNN